MQVISVLYNEDMKTGNESVKVKSVEFKKIIFTLIIISTSFNQAIAKDSSATLLLSAIVNEIIAISIAPSANNSNLNVSENQIDLLVATIYESSNSSNGYLVKARSENNGKIQSVKGKDNIPYSLRYAGGGALRLSNSDQTIREQSLGGVYTASSKSVTISFQGVPISNLSSGNYSDMITFTIESK